MTPPLAQPLESTDSLGLDLDALLGSPGRCGSTSEPHRAAEDQYAQNEDGLFNDRLCASVVIREKPEHRLMIMLKATGRSNAEIAQATGFSVLRVQQILRQPWARERLIKELNATGRNALTDLIKGAAVDSVLRLIDERDNPQARPADRISAARELLDRFLGKPTQKVESHVFEAGESVEALDQQIRSLEEEEKRLLGGHN